MFRPARRFNRGGDAAQFDIFFGGLRGLAHGFLLFGALGLSVFQRVDFGEQAV